METRYPVNEPVASSLVGPTGSRLYEQDLKEAEGLYKEFSESGNVVGKFLVENGKDKRGSRVMDVGGLR